MIPPRAQGPLISNNIYPMDCEPSLTNQQPQSIQIPQSSSMNINPRYLQHIHGRSNRYSNIMAAPSLSGCSYVGQKYAPASLPIELITVATGSTNTGSGGSGSSSILVLPTNTQDHHLNSSSLIINNHSVNANSYAFNDISTGPSIHQGFAKVGSANSRNHNSNSSNNNTTNDESMVGVCVQQSPVVIH
jgi:hypothetical protein